MVLCLVGLSDLGGVFVWWIVWFALSVFVGSWAFVCRWVVVFFCILLSWG